MLKCSSFIIITLCSLFICSCEGMDGLFITNSNSHADMTTCEENGDIWDVDLELCIHETIHDDNPPGNTVCNFEGANAIMYLDTINPHGSSQDHLRIEWNFSADGTDNVKYCFAANIGSNCDYNLTSNWSSAEYLTFYAAMPNGTHTIIVYLQQFNGTAVNGPKVSINVSSNYEAFIIPLAKLTNGVIDKTNIRAIVFEASGAAGETFTLDVDDVKTGYSVD